MRAGANSPAVMKNYARAYEARHGEPQTATYLPLTYERGWVIFRTREQPKVIAARYRVAALTARLNEAAADARTP